jgi:uncharacterized protein YkwD
VRRWLVVPVLLLAACGGSAGSSWAPGGESPTNPTPITPTPTTLAEDLAFCVSETNRLRATKGASALAQSASLEAYGALAAENDHKSGVPHEYFKAHPIGGSAWAENQVNRWGGSSIRVVMQAAINAFWAEGPGGGHYDNIMGNYTQMGCGVYRVGTATTIVQEFKR